MSEIRIPFNRADLAGDELRYVQEAIDRGHLAGAGELTRRCERLLEEELGAPRVLLTTSCTHALEMAALLLGIGPGDEVIVPSFAFVSCANAFALRGARPVFADVRPDTLNLDETRLAGLVTERTRALLVLHYAGVGCAMAPIRALAAERGLAIVEDAAHGLFGRHGGRPLGSFGELATLSFHETKNVTCGEGGALVVNDPSHLERAEILREKGTDRSRFFRGMVDRYTWQDVGSSWVMSEILAGFLWGQLERRRESQAARQRIWAIYARDLREWAAAQGVALPHVPADCEPPAHIFHLLLPTARSRQALIDHLRQRGILAVFHYLPLHLSPMGRRLGGLSGQCPVAEDVSERLVRLPLYRGLSVAQQAEVIAAVQAFDV